MDQELSKPSTELSMDGFQVVRRELFAHTKEPSISFSRYQTYVNAACLTGFEDAECAQVLVDPYRHILALRPCQNSLRDALLWCSTSGGRRKPRKSTCKLFFTKIASMMGWNHSYRYKVLGRLVRANGEALLVFNLAAAEAYPLNGKSPVSLIPEDLRNRFGLPAEEHARTLEIPLFETYSIFTIGESNVPKETEHRPNGEL